jgi:hypothetical protein
MCLRSDFTNTSRSAFATNIRPTDVSPLEALFSPSVDPLTQLMHTISEIGISIVGQNGAAR